MRAIGQSVMRPIMLGLFRAMRFSRDRAPSPPPIDPNEDNPHMLYVPEDDGLATASIDFQSVTGNIVVRIFGRANTAGPLDVAATVTQATEGVETELTLIGDSWNATAGSSYCYMFAGKILPATDATLTFSLSGEAGRTWIRIGDLEELPDDFADNVQHWSNLSGDGTTDNYYVEIAPSINEGYLMLSVAGWLEAGGDPISGTGDSMQFTDSSGDGLTGASVYFGTAESPGGEPGWYGYVFYPEVDSGVTAKPNGLLVAIQGATLP